MSKDNIIINIVIINKNLIEVKNISYYYRAVLGIIQSRST